MLPLDNSTLARWNSPRPNLDGRPERVHLLGRIDRRAGQRCAPNILNKAYTITAEVEIPEGGAEGMIVTEGGRFGGYGLFLSKGVEGFRQGNVVFLYNLLDLKRTVWAGPELAPGKHTIVFDYKFDGPGLGKGGTGVLSVDGKAVAKNSLEHGPRSCFRRTKLRRWPGHAHRRRDGRVSLRSPFKFTGKIDNSFKLEPAPIQRRGLAVPPLPTRAAARKTRHGCDEEAACSRRRR